MASSYSNIHPVDQILTSLVNEAIPSDNQLIADKIFETVKIPERSGTLLLEETRNFMGAGAGLDLWRFRLYRYGRHFRQSISWQ